MAWVFISHVFFFGVTMLAVFIIGAFLLLLLFILPAIPPEIKAPEESREYWMNLYFEEKRKDMYLDDDD
jgi:hypothetical protein